MMTEAPSSLMSSSANRRRQQLAMINSSSGSGGSVNGERVGGGEEATDGGSGNMTVKRWAEGIEIQGVPCPCGLGFVDLDLGCSTTLLGQ